ncbi:MAG: hypothetical protein QM734_12325, partial [Cyclobacteriaceae bacterium]
MKRELRGVSVIIFLLVVISLASKPTYGQRPYADSLKKILDHTSNPKLQVDLMCDIAYDYFDFDDDKAEVFARQALELAEANNYLSGKKYALTILGLGDFSFGDYQHALKNLFASRNIKADQKPEYTGYNLMLIGSTYRDLAKYDSAEYFYKQAL